MRAVGQRGGRREGDPARGLVSKKRKMFFPVFSPPVLLLPLNKKKQKNTSLSPQRPPHDPLPRPGH